MSKGVQAYIHSTIKGDSILDFPWNLRPVNFFNKFPGTSRLYQAFPHLSLPQRCRPWIPISGTKGVTHFSCKYFLSHADHFYFFCVMGVVSGKIKVVLLTVRAMNAHCKKINDIEKNIDKSKVGCLRISIKLTNSSPDSSGENERNIKLQISD